MQRVLLLLSVCLLTVVGTTPKAEAQGQKCDAFGDPLPNGAIARIGTLRYRTMNFGQEEGPILSPDGKLVAMLNAQAGLELWEVPSWKQRPLIEHLTARINPTQFDSFTFTSDSKTLAAYEFGNPQVHLFDTATGKCIKQLSLPKERRITRTRLLISQDQKTLVCAGQNEKADSIDVLVWDLATTKVKQSIKTGPFQSPYPLCPQLALAPDGSRLVRVVRLGPDQTRQDTDHSLEFWDLHTGKSIRKIPTEAALTQQAFSPDGKWLAASSCLSILRIYDAVSGKEMHNIRLRRSYFNPLAFSPDSKSLYLSEEDAAKISQWDPQTGERLAVFPVPTLVSAIRQFSFSPEGKVLALGSYDNALHLWEVKTGKLFSPIGLPLSPITEVAFSPQQELFVGAASAQAAWWDSRTGMVKREQALELMVNGERRSGARLIMAPSGEFFASVAGPLGIHEAKTGKLLYDNMTQSYPNNKFGFFANGSRAAALHKNTVRVWNSRSGRDVARFEVSLQGKELGAGMAVSPSGKYFAVATVGNQEQGRVLLWDFDKKKMVREWSWPAESPAHHIDFSADDRWLAIGGQQGRLQLSRIGSGKRDEQLDLKPVGCDIMSVRFSPDSRQLACAVAVPTRGNDASKIFLFELASKKLRLELPGHAHGVATCLSYSHDSVLLASGATDTTALVWQAGLRAFADTPSMADVPIKEVQRCFEQMASTDAPAAFQSMIKLARTPTQTVKLLEEKIASAQKPDTEGRTIEQWIESLGSGQFTARSKASRILLKFGPSAELPLRAALAKPRDVETKRRIEELLERLAAQELTAQEILHVRTVEVLEAIATPEARAVLTRWAGGDTAAVLTEQARQALARLGK